VTHIAYTAVPTITQSFALRHWLTSQLKSSLQEILDAIDEVIPQQQHALLQKRINGLRPHQHPSAMLHLLNGYFLGAIEQNNITAVRQAATALEDPTLWRVTELEPQKLQDLPPLCQELFLEALNRESPVDVEILPFHEELYLKNQQLLDQALDLILAAAPDIYGELTVWTSGYLFIRANHIKAGSSFDFSGMIYLEQTAVQTLVDMIDFVVHESAHQYLHAISAQDPMLLNEPDERYTAPFRTDMRPVFGIYHAVLVLARILHVFKRILALDVLSPQDRAMMEERQALFEKRYESSWNLVIEKGKFTTLGKSFWDTIPHLL
jgi:hypothetical protein